MNSLPDTSAWSLLLPRRPVHVEEHPVAVTLRRQLEGEAGVFLTGIVYQEVLQRARLERQRRELLRFLRPFPMLDRQRGAHERAARLRDQCLRKGVSISTVDVLIAQVAIDFDCVLLTTDEDFSAIARHSHLKLHP